MKAILAALLLFPLVSQASVVECTIKVANHESGVKTISQVISPPDSIRFSADWIPCTLAVLSHGKGSSLECYLDGKADNYLGADRLDIEEIEPSNRIIFGVNGKHYNVASTCTVKD